MTKQLKSGNNFTAKIFGNRMKIVRAAKGISQEELAHEIEKTPHYISDIETGKRKPNLNTLVDLMIALETTPNEMFCDLVEYDENKLTKAIQILSDIPDGDKEFYLDILERYKTILDRKNEIFPLRKIWRCCSLQLNPA